MGFDVVITSGDGRKAYLNDVLGTQESTTVHFADLILKPGTGNITQGTAVVDGQMDDVWKTANTFWLNMNDGNAKAAAKAKLLWDDAKLYVYAEVLDAQMAEGDGLSIFLAESRDSVNFQTTNDRLVHISLNNEVKLLGKSEDSKTVESVVTKMGNGYVVEASIAWLELTPKVYSQIGLELKVNDANDGEFTGSLSWFDEQPAEVSVSFGQVSLAAAGKEKEEAENPDAKFSKAGAFTGLVEQGTMAEQPSGGNGNGSANETEQTPSGEKKQGNRGGIVIIVIAAVVIIGLIAVYARKKTGTEKSAGQNEKEKKNSEK